MPQLSILNKALRYTSLSLSLMTIPIFDNASSLETDNINKKENIGYYSQFETDVSSIRPIFKNNNETFFIYENNSDRFTLKNVSAFDEVVSNIITDEDIMIAMQDHELIVKMPPIREYKIRAKVKSITKASPRVIEPEEIDGENIYLV